MGSKDCYVFEICDFHDFHRVDYSRCHDFQELVERGPFSIISIYDDFTKYLVRFTVNPFFIKL